MENFPIKKTEISIIKLPKGFYYPFTRKDIRSFLLQFERLPKTLSDVICRGFSSVEEKTTGKQMREIHERYGFCVGYLNYNKAQSSLILRGIRETTISKSLLSEELRIKMQIEIFDWLKSKFEEPDSAPDKRVTKYLYLKQEPGNKVSFTLR